MTIETPPQSTIQKNSEITSRSSQDIGTNISESDTEQSQKHQSSQQQSLLLEATPLQSDMQDQRGKDLVQSRNFPLNEQQDQSWSDSERLGILRTKLENIWLNDDELVSQLKEIMQNAVYEGPKWTILVDYKTKLSALKEIVKLKWYYKPQTVINVVNAFAKPPVLY